MSLHANSLSAFKAEEPKLSRRALDILFFIRAHGPMTDRQIANGMHFHDMNSIRPRVTELVEQGLLMEVGNVKCRATGRTVRVVGIPQKQGELI